MGLSTRMKVDATDDKFVIQYTQDDVGAILAANRESYNATASTSRKWRGEWTRVASIPLVLINEWWSQGINFFNADGFAEVKKKLNDVEYEKLRTAPGRF